MNNKVRTPVISVVMPVYNAEKYLSESIESILNQSFDDFEFLIIDDASTDKSAEIIRSFPDKRIVFISKSANTGLIASLNMVFKIAKGKYIARMDADDISLPDRFMLQYQYMENHPDVLVLGTFYKIIGTDIITTNLPVNHDQAKVFSIINSPVAHPTVFLRKDIFISNNILYDENYKHAEDFEIWTRVLDIGKIENLPEVLLNYRRHNTQVSNIRGELQIEAANSVRLNQLKRLISFARRPYGKDFAIGVLTGSINRISCDDLLKLKKLLVDIYGSNELLKIYHSGILMKLLRDIWLKYFFSTYNYRISYLSVLFPCRNRAITKVGFYLGLKYFVKSLIGYKGI